jgi:hypothetical protein
MRSLLFMTASLAIVLASAITLAQTQHAITVTVDGQTYSCTPGGSSGGDCASKVGGFNDQAKNCQLSYGAQWCFNDLWPKFKANFPNCVYDANQACFDLCKKSNGPQFCYNTCQ